MLTHVENYFYILSKFYWFVEKKSEIIVLEQVIM